MITLNYSILSVICGISSIVKGGASSSRSQHPSYNESQYPERIKINGEECKNTTINDLPNEILFDVFKTLAYSYVRGSLARVNKKWKTVAYSENLRPTEVSLFYDEYSNEKKLEAAIAAIGVLKTLDIHVEGDINGCVDLNNFASEQRQPMNNLECLKINFDWTSSNDNAIDLITKLLLGGGEITKLVIKWKDKEAIKSVPRTDESKSYESFWKLLEKSKVNDFKLELINGYADYKAKRVLHFSRSVAPFLAYLSLNEYIYSDHSRFFKNLRKFTLKVPPNEGSYKFAKKVISNSWETLEILDIDFYYFVHWVNDENLFADLEKCISLQKLIVNFPLIDYKWNENSIHGKLEYPAINNLVKFLNARSDVYFELKTSFAFLHLYNLYRFLTFPEEKIPLKAVTFVDDFWNGKYKGDVGYLLMKGRQKLRKLKIVFQHDRFHSAKPDVVKHYFELASKLLNLEEFFIDYSRDEHSFKDNYDDLKNLARTGSETIMKITMRVTSLDYLNYLDSCKTAKKHYTKEAVEKVLKQQFKKHDDYVAKHALNLSKIRKFQSDLQNMFKVESKLVTKYRGSDSHQLTLTRILN